MVSPNNVPLLSVCENRKYFFVERSNLLGVEGTDWYLQTVLDG